ncbi:MAG: dihydroorotate dehydrogenase [Actinomycetota bacterium]|nr:dihydroorotate dehydrogenase [Actinomycetota bacterium]
MNDLARDGTRGGRKDGASALVLNASGCLDALAAPDVARSLDAFVTKTVTLLPREGNAPVRIAETQSAMLNSIGLANPGIDEFVSRTLPRLGELGVPVWVSVGGFSATEYAEICARLDDEEVAVIELNVSCPNVASPLETTEEIVRAARRATSKPLYAKLSPSVPDIASIASAAAEAGADGLSVVNTVRGLALESVTLRPVLSTATGGLSGPALRPLALASVFACHAATELPIVGMGGIETGRDALELIAAGASACALGTVLFRDPDAPARVRAELECEARSHGFATPQAARGIAHQVSHEPLLV